MVKTIINGNTKDVRMSEFNYTGERQERVARIVKAAARQTVGASNELPVGTSDADERPRSSSTIAGTNPRDARRQAVIYHLRDQSDDDVKRPTSIRPPGYSSWAGMKQRCSNPNHKFYPDYGGRGISYVPEWHSFQQFIYDMGLPPTASSTLDRLDVDADYCPENCIWASPQDQARNRRSNRYIMYNGERHTLAGLAERHGLSPSTLSARLRRGSIEAALHTPLHRRGIRREASTTSWAAFNRWPSNLSADSKDKLEEHYRRRSQSDWSRPRYYLHIIAEEREKAADVLLANPDEVDQDELIKSQKLMNACDDATELYRRIRFVMDEDFARMKSRDNL